MYSIASIAPYKMFGLHMSKNINDGGIRQNVLSISELTYRGV